MPVPTHDISCKTRAFQVECDDCKNLVWFFSCSCGSKIFFNELGYPWEQHFCKEYFIKKNLELLVDIEKMTPEHIYDTIIKREKLSGETVDDNLWGIIEETIGKRKSKLTVERQEPQAGFIEVSGKVMELNTSVNIFTRLGYDAGNTISVKLLGELGKTKWAFARVRSNADKRNKCLEFEILIPSDYLKINKLAQGNFIVGIAQGTKHPKGFIWQLLKHDMY